MKNTCKHLLITTALSGVLFASIAMADEANYSPVLEISNMSSRQRTIGEINYMQPIFGNDNNLVFADVKLKADTKKGKEANVGLVYRHNLNDAVVLGVYNYFDYRKTGNNFTVAGYTGGVEALSKYVDARVNIYLPQNKKKKIVNNNSKSVDIIGTSLFATSGGHTYEQSYKGFDVEIGTPIFAFNDDLNDKIGTKVFVAKYDFTSKGAKKISGIRFRMEQPLGTIELGNGGLHFMLNAETQYDNVRKRQYGAGISARFVFDEDSKIGRRGKKAGLSSRMMDKVIRDVDIVTAENKGKDTVDFFRDENGREIKNLYHVSGTKTADGDGTEANPFSTAQLNRLNTNEALVVAVDATPELIARPDVVNGTEVTLHAGNTHVINLAVSKKGQKTIAYSDKNMTVNALSFPKLTVKQVQQIVEYINEVKRSTISEEAENKSEKNELQSSSYSSYSSVSAVLPEPEEELLELEPSDYIAEADMLAKNDMLAELMSKVEIVEPDEEDDVATPVLRDVNEEAAQAAALADCARLIREGAGYVVGQVQGAISAINSKINSGLEGIADATDQNYDMPEAPVTTSEVPASAPAVSNYLGDQGYGAASAASSFEMISEVLTRGFWAYAPKPEVVSSPVAPEDYSDRMPAFGGLFGEGVEAAAAAVQPNPTTRILNKSEKLAQEAQAPASAQNPLSKIIEDLVESDRSLAEAVAPAKVEQENIILTRSARHKLEAENQLISEADRQKASARLAKIQAELPAYVAEKKPIADFAKEMEAFGAYAPEDQAAAARAEVLARVKALDREELVRTNEAALEIQRVFRGSRVREILPVAQKNQEVHINQHLLLDLERNVDGLLQVAQAEAVAQASNSKNAKLLSDLVTGLGKGKEKMANIKSGFESALDVIRSIAVEKNITVTEVKALGFESSKKIAKKLKLALLEAEYKEAVTRLEAVDQKANSSEFKVEKARVDLASSILEDNKYIASNRERLVKAIIGGVVSNPSSPAFIAFRENLVSKREALSSELANNDLSRSKLSTARKNRTEAGGAAAGSIATPRRLFGGGAGAAGTPGAAE